MIGSCRVEIPREVTLFTERSSKATATTLPLVPGFRYDSTRMLVGALGVEHILSRSLLAPEAHGHVVGENA